MPATKQPFHRPAAALALAVLLAGACPLSTRADTATWATAVSGNWTDSINWLPQVVPNNGASVYDVLINTTGSAYAVTLPSAVAINNLTLNSASATLLLQGTSNSPSLTINGGFNLQAGALSASNATLTLNGTWSNSGAISLTNTTLILGNYDPDQVLGNFAHTGETIFSAYVQNIAVDLSNTFAGPADIGSGAGFVNCTVSATNTSPTILAGSQVEFANSTINANLSMQPGSIINFPQSNPNGFTLNGTLSMESSGTNSVAIYATQLNGTGTIIFNGTGSQNVVGAGNQNYVGGSGTIEPGITLKTGTAGGTIASFVNMGNISASTPGATITLSGSFINDNAVEASKGGALLIQSNFTNAAYFSLTDASATALGQNNFGNFYYQFSNQGTITLQNSTFTINSSWSNTGLVSAVNSTLSFPQGAAPGNINATNSSILLQGPASASTFSLNTNQTTLGVDGVLDLGGATTTLSGPSTSLVLAGGSLQNGTLTTTNGASVDITRDATLASIALDHANINLQSIMLLITNNFAPSSNATLLGTGTLTLNGPGRIQANAGLTIGPGIQILSGEFSGGIQSSLQGGGSLTLQGVISAQTPGYYISVITQMTNSGLMQAINGGMLQLQAFSSNTGKIYAGTSSVVDISVSYLAATNQGSILADGGSFFFFGDHLQPLVGAMTFEGGSILEASNGGSLNFSSPTLSVLCPISLSNASAVFDSNSQSIATITGTGFVSIGDGKSLTSDGIVANSLQLGVGSTHTIRLNSGGDSINAGASKLSTLTLAGSPGSWSSLLDLTNNALIIQATSFSDKENKIATLLDEVNQARGGLANTWTGTAGITSSTVASGDHVSTGGMGLAVADAAELPNITSLSTYRGQSVDSNSIIVVAAHTGDVTLDGRIDIADLNAVTSHWQQTGAIWSEGDTAGGPNGGPNGIVDIADLNAVTSFWQWGVGSDLAPAGETLTGPQSSAIGTGSAVPEPVSLGLLALAAPMLLLRRRRLLFSLKS